MQLMQTAGNQLRLHELHESTFPFVSCIKFICWKLPKFSDHVSGVAVYIFYRKHIRSGQS